MRAEGPRLGDAAGRPSAGCPANPTCDVLEPDAGDDGHAVPLDEAVVGHLVAERLEPLDRELLVLALGLLDGEHVDVAALEPGLDAVDAGADGVDVPGGDAHAAEP